MSDITAEKLIAVYIKMRDAKEALDKEYEAKKAELVNKMNTINGELLDILAKAGGESIKTSNGSVRKTIKTRYWTSDWGSMYKFIKEEDAIYLLEQRVHQSNMKKFLTENPDKLPMGLNMESSYSVVVTKPRRS